MNYSAVVATPAAFGAAAVLPHEGVLFFRSHGYRFVRL
jgi:hypothetical protein